MIYKFTFIVLIITKIGKNWRNIHELFELIFLRAVYLQLVLACNWSAIYIGTLVYILVHWCIYIWPLMYCWDSHSQRSSIRHVGKHLYRPHLVRFLFLMNYIIEAIHYEMTHLNFIMFFLNSVSTVNSIPRFVARWV